MKLNTVVTGQRTASWLSENLPAILLLAIALGIRCYKLSGNPLWLDEIYGYLLGQRGIAAILQNSLHDPHPPFYYMFQWAASGFGSYHTEWAWRWPSVLFGSLTVPLVYISAARIANRLCAFLVALLLAVSPTHLFFSQEARVFVFGCFLSALTPLLIWKILKNSQNKVAWIGLALLTVLGLYSTYNYLYVAFVQVAFLVILFPKSKLLYLYAALIAISFLPLVVPMQNSLSSTLEGHLNNQALTFKIAAGALLAGEPLRYGQSWYHSSLPVIVGTIAIPGIWINLKRRGTGGIGPYFVLQLLLPLFLYALAASLLTIRMPVYESKQFLNLLPALYIIVAAGLYFFQQRLPTYAFIILTGLLIGIVIAGSVSGLKRYWTVTKSPEALAALLVVHNIQEKDAVVSTNYSLDFALSFYYPENNVYIKPRVDGDQIFFSLNSSQATNQDHSSIHDSEIDLESVRKHPRLWLLTRPGSGQSPDRLIAKDCNLLAEWFFPPFQVELLADCP